MKTTGRENPNRWARAPRNRAHGAAGQNRSRSIKWAAKQEKFQPQEMCFFLTSTFIERSKKPLLRPLETVAALQRFENRRPNQGFAGRTATHSKAQAGNATTISSERVKFSGSDAK
jgi:hypothetical protein